MHRAPEEQAQSECEWKRAKGVRSSWIAGALVPTLALTREAFSWKPFGSKRDRYAPHPAAQQALISRCLPPADHGYRALGSLHAPSLKARLPTRPPFTLGDFLRVAVRDRPAKSLKGHCRMTNLCGVSHGQLAKVELEET